MEKGAVAIFVKTPGFSPIKTRLARDLGREKAEEFHLQSAAIVERTVKSVAEVEGYWAVAEAGAIDALVWRGLRRIGQSLDAEAGLGTRLDYVYRKLLEQHPFALLIGADAPQLKASHILSAVRACREGRWAIGPSRDGGFYLFGGSRPIAREIWESVSYSCETTRNELETNIVGIAPIEHLPELRDVDDFADYVALRADYPGLLS